MKRSVSPRCVHYRHTNNTNSSIRYASWSRITLTYRKEKHHYTCPFKNHCSFPLVIPRNGILWSSFIDIASLFSTLSVVERLTGMRQLGLSYRRALWISQSLISLLLLTTWTTASSGVNTEPLTPNFGNDKILKWYKYQSSTSL